MKTKTYKDTDGTCLVELRRGGMTVAPPSLHKSREPIEWSLDRPVAKIGGDEIERLVDSLAACTLLARRWPEEGSRQAAALHLSGALLSRGYQVADVERLLGAVVAAAGDEEPMRRREAVSSTARAIAAGTPVTGWGSIAKFVGRNVVRQVKEWLPRLAGGAEMRSRPVVAVSARQLPEVSKEALQALAEANDPPKLFVRSGRLVRLRYDEHNRPVLEPVNESILRAHLARSADYVKVTQSGEFAVAPPFDVVRDILALGEWPFPPLVALTETPVLRSDGTVLSRAGYDARTGLLYLPRSGFAMPELDLTPEGVAAALVQLQELVCDFRFVDASSRANYLALLLTPIVRLAISGQVPLALLDAPQQGSGKSFLASIFALLLTGRSAAMTAAPESEEEWRKRITATLLGGTTIVILDNVDRVLASSSLAILLTSDVWSDRVLGRSETVEVPQRLTCVATGNNLRLGGDIPRRSYYIRLDPGISRPWLRTGFRHPDILGWVAEQRAPLVGCLLTLAAAWWAAGRPSGGAPPMGGFSSWSETVGGILAHAGVPGFLGNLDALYDEVDEEARQWESFLLTWKGSIGDQPVTTARLYQDLLASDVLRQSAPDEIAKTLDEKPNTARVRIGSTLAKLVGRRFGEQQLRIERQRDSHAKVAVWYVAAE